MKLPKGLQKEKNKKEKDDLVFIHSRCCGENWKLIYKDLIDKYVFVCKRCGFFPTMKAIKIDINQFSKEKCPCGCNNYGIFSKCCNASFEVVYHRDLDRVLLLCECCHRLIEGIIIYEEPIKKFAKSHPCKHCDSLILRDLEGNVLRIN